jgi:hypothetical protein
MQEEEACAPAPAENHLSPLERAELARAARRTRAKEAADAQRALDLEAIGELEDRYGINSLSVLWVEHVPGLPTAIVIKRPEPVYVKRYQDRMNAKVPDQPAALRELAAVTIIHPDKATFEKLLGTFPALDLQAGYQAIELIAAHTDAQGKG